MRKDIVGYNLLGYPFNKKYPPDEKRYGSQYAGYKTSNRETFFYSFAVQGYDVQYIYHGKRYYVMFEPDAVYESDEHFTAQYQKFEDGNDYIEHYVIEGKPLIEIIDELEDVDPV